MSSIFPTPAYQGEIFTVGNITYVYSGYAWVKQASSGNLTVGSLTATSTISLTSSTNSTSTNSGSLTVTGGAGIAGNLYVGGTISASGGFSGLNASTIFQNTSSVTVTDTGTVHNIVVTVTNITNTVFLSTETDFYQNVKILSATSSTNTITGALVVTGGAGIGGDLWIGGVLYSGGHAVLTTSSFNANINAGTDIRIDTVDTSTIVINNTSTLETVTRRGSTSSHAITITNTSVSTSSSTGALTIAGGVGIQGDLYVAGTVNAPNLRLVDALFASNQVQLNTAATAVLDIYDITKFRSAKYLVQIDSYNTGFYDGGTTATFQVTELLMLVDNNAGVHITEYASVYNYDHGTYGDLGTFSADVQMDNMVRFYFTPADATPKIISVVRMALVI